MPLRSAGIKDPSLLNSLKNIEDRVRKQEQKPAAPSTANLEQTVADLKEEVRKIKIAIEKTSTANVFVQQGTMHRPGYVPDPGPVNVRTDRVLHATGEWSSPLAGYLSLVPPGSGGTSLSDPIANLRGSLAVTGALTADRVYARVWDLIEVQGYTFDTTGIAVATNLIAWQAPYNATVLQVKGYRVGGTGATINARRNGASQHLSGDLSLTSANVWMDGGVVQDVTYTAGDKLELMLVSVTAAPTQVRIEVVFQRR